MNKKVFELLVAADFPAESYEVNIAFRLETLGTLDELQEIFEPGDNLKLRLISSDLDMKNYGELFVVKTSKGHRLELQISADDDLEAVIDTLGMKFIPYA